MFRLLAHIATRRPTLVVLVMIAVSATALSLSPGLSDRLSTQGFINDEAESTKALDQLAQANGADARAQIVALISHGRPIDSREGRRLVQRVTTAFKNEPDMKLVRSPFEDGNVDKSLISKDGDSAVVVGNLKDGIGESDATRRLHDQLDGMREVRLGGWETTQHDISATIENDLRRAEMMAFPLVMLIALFVFRGLIAALLPVLVGAITIPVAFALIRLFDGITDLSVFALNLTTGMGLGLAIDYSLLMVTRYREELAAGAATREAVRTTVATAGRTVAFSALTVAGATSALGVFPLKFLYSMAIGGATVALVSATVALTLLPALLMLLGPRIDRFGIPRRPAEHSIAMWHKLATRVMSRPGSVTLVTTVLLLALAIPVTGLRFTSVDATVLERDADPRVVQTTVENEFPRNEANSTLMVVVASGRHDAMAVARDARRVRREAARVSRRAAKLKRDSAALRTAMLTPGSDPARLKRESTRIERESSRVRKAMKRVDRRAERLQRSKDRLDRYERRVEQYARRVAGVAGVESVGEVEVAGKRTWQFRVYTTDSRYSLSTQKAVEGIRALAAPGRRWVGGTSASFVDLRDTIMERLVLTLLLIGGITFIALFLMTGSVVLPVKTFIMNLLTLAATFGVLVTIFQENRLEGLLRYEGQGALELTQPVLLFAIAFGLATDYGVFLLNRIKELHDAGQSNDEAVANGVARTGRVISSAALLFIVAILAFSTSDIVFIKELGIGMAMAVAIDSTIVRAMLVPALMKLLGDYNWWAPRPLRRLHERIGLSEGPSASPAVTTVASTSTSLPAFDLRPLTPQSAGGNGAARKGRLAHPGDDGREQEPARVAMAVTESGGGDPERVVVGSALAGDFSVDAVGDAVPGSSSDGVGNRAAVDDRQQSVDDLGVELAAGVANHLRTGLFESDRLTVGAVRDHRVERVADQHDAARQRNLFARKPVWIALAVPALVFVANRLRNR